MPQEEVPLYESKGKQFVKNKPSYPVGMSPEYVVAQKAKKEVSKTNPIPGLVIQPETKKKKKKKSKSKGVNDLADDLAKTVINEKSSLVLKNEVTTNETSTTKNNTTLSSTPGVQISTMDPLKRLKNLRKKIREIESLETKIKNKDIKNPDKEMLDKVARKTEIQEEIKVLEANQ